MEDKKPPVKPAPKQWKLAKGERADIPAGQGSGIMKVTNEDLKNPKVIQALAHIESVRGIKLFDLVFIRE